MSATDLIAPLPSLSRLRELLSYDPYTGNFHWLSGPGRGRPKASGRLAGCVAKHLGYRLIRVDGRLYYAHRLAWLMGHGRESRLEIDHINCVRLDNRLSNLREATGSQNHANVGLSSKNTSGLKGASWMPKRKKWRACISHNGKFIHLGHFDSKEEAHAAYLRASLKIYGEFARAA